MVYYFLKNAESFGPTQVLSCKSLLSFSREKFIMKMISRKIFYYCCLHSCWPLTLEGSKSGSSSSSSPSSPSSSSSSSSSNSSSSRASPKKTIKKLVKIQQNYNFFRENKITNMFLENKSGCSFHIKLKIQSARLHYKSSYFFSKMLDIFQRTLFQLFRNCSHLSKNLKNN